MPNKYVTREDAVSAMKGELCDRHCSFGKPVVTVTGAEHRIMQLPAADVVPVVRCKDCEQYVAGEIGYGKCNFFKTAIFSEFYCRYGGKKGRPE